MSGWNEDVMDHREMTTIEDSFQRDENDWPVGEPLSDGAEPEWGGRHDRLGEAVALVGGYERYTLTADRDAAVDVRKEVAKLSRKLKRHGGEVRIVSEEEIQHDHAWLKRKVNGSRVPVVVYQTVFTIEAPAVAGENAKLVGTFELAEDGVQVYKHVLPGYSEDDLEPFVGRWWECDHCGYKRQRHASFVCEQVDGTRLLIGRQCSMAYMGLSPAEILARSAIHTILSGAGDEEESCFGGGSYMLHMQSVVERAYQVAKKFGGYSKDIADDFYRDMSALSGAKDYGRDRTNHNIREEYRKRGEPNPPLDLNALADYIEHASGDYGHNLRIAMSCDYIKPKRYRTVVSGVGVFVGRVLRQKKEEVKRPTAKFLTADVGKRVDFMGLVERTTPLPSNFGPKTLVGILADDGSRVVHFCSGSEVPQAGQRFSIKATVKEHKVHERFGPQTIVTRAVYTLAADQPKLL